MGCETFILGGDWNRTWDTNIDVLDMAAIPSKLRSEKLKKMCETLKITDPYQVLYPNKLEYTYIPAALHHTNRSRIDFFCVLTVVINNIQNWTINNALSSTNFDHKGILLDFRKKVNFIKNMQIRNSNIKNELVRASALAAAVKCYIHHSLIDEILTLQKKTDTLRIVGSIYSSLERIQCNTIKLSGEPDNIILKNTIEGDKNALKEILTDLPSFIWLESLNLSCGAEFFFEALCCGVREACLKQQNYLFKSCTAFRISLEKEINVLKQAPIENRNQINLKECTLEVHNVYCLLSLGEGIS